MNNLISEKPIEVRKLIDVAYLVLVLAAFAWAKDFFASADFGDFDQFFACACHFSPGALAFPSRGSRA